MIIRFSPYFLCKMSASKSVEKKRNKQKSKQSKQSRPDVHHATTLHSFFGSIRNTEVSQASKCDNFYTAVLKSQLAKNDIEKAANETANKSMMDLLPEKEYEKEITRLNELLISEKRAKEKLYTDYQALKKKYVKNLQALVVAQSQLLGSNRTSTLQIKPASSSTKKNIIINSSD